MKKEDLNKMITRATRKAYDITKKYQGREFKFRFEQELFTQIGREITTGIPQRQIQRMCNNIWSTTDKMRKLNPDMKTGEWLKIVADVVTKFLWDNLF